MKGKERDSTEDLLRRLQESLTDREDADGTPEEVFADRSVSVKKSETDEDIAAFDSYMAQLLGEVVPEEEKPSGKRKQTDRKISHPKDGEEAAPEYTADEETELADEEENSVEPDIYAGDGEEQEQYVYGESGEEVSEDIVSTPDVRVELPMLTDDEEAEEDVAIELTAQEATVEAEHTLPAEPFEVLEQLAIDDAPTAEREEIPEIDGKTAAEAVQEPIPFEEPTEVSPNLPAYEFSDEPDEADEPVTPPLAVAPVEVVQSPKESVTAEPLAEDDLAEQESETALPVESPEIAPVELREGDVLLDAEDELPSTESNVEKTTAIPAPVASPLDAARQRHEQQASGEAPRPKQSPLDAMAAKAQGNVATPGGVTAFGKATKGERTLTDDEVELLLDLGYDSNLTQKVGSRRVEAVRYRRQDDERARRALRGVYGCVGEEYSSHAQDKQIAATYRTHTKGALLRVVLSALLSLVILAADLLPLFRHRLPGAFAELPTTGAYSMIGLLLLALNVLLLWPQLLRGWAALVRFSPVPASLPALLVLLTAFYDVLLLLETVSGVLLNFPTAVTLLLLASSELMTVQRESLTFEVVSARSRKIVMEPILPRKKKVVRGGHIVKIINDEGGRRAWRVRPCDQLAGYFRRHAEASPRYHALSPLLVIALVAALAVGVLSLLLSEEPSLAVSAGLLTLQLALPSAALICYSYPLLTAARALSQCGCAIVGQSAVDEYAGEKTLLFDDTEMFRSKSSTEITIKGSGDTKKYIRYAKRLFATLGGTLRGISTSDLSSEAYEERVEILKIYEQGVEARIDGKVTVMAGTSAHMVQHGIRVPGESAELLVRRSVESCMLYLAFDGKLKLGYEVDYRISGRFEQMAAELVHAGTAVAIETCDPSIHADFLTRSRKVGACPIGVVKPVRFERRGDALLCDSGVVATRSARDIAVATEACDRLVENDRQLRGFYRMAALAGGVIGLALSLLGMLNVTATLIAAIVQLVWCVPTMMLSRKNLTNEQRSESEHVNRSSF